MILTKVLEVLHVWGVTCMCVKHTHTQITFLILICTSGFHHLLMPPLNSQHMHMGRWKKKKAAGFIK